MSTAELLRLNLFSPVILCFFLGVAATLVRSDLKFPDALYQGLSIYLLLAIGLKGGAALSASAEAGLWLVLAAGLVLGAAIPLWCYPVLRWLGRFKPEDAAAVAAHYGSVSVVTFLAAIAFLRAMNEPFEGYLPALVAVMEVPGIAVALLLVPRPAGSGRVWGETLHTVLAGKSVFLLLGGLFVGMLAGERGMEKVDAFFVAPFAGVLCLFLLEMGMVASRRFGDLRRAGLFLIVFALLMPLLNGAVGIGLGWLCDLSRGGAFVLGVLAASASYIAAPATVRLALPAASPAIYLTASLGITFPFNLTVGIPLYFALSGWLYGV
ncbi:MAG: sodium-dependent bicarbonate transport family permease [Puniceicoccaceae bacterium]|nr:MAG: sodium-dependent bicarbonate transport family permease [Puniceicoccaceae bacterium]